MDVEKDDNYEKSRELCAVLEAADSLPFDAQEELIEILQKRNMEHRRDEIAKEVKKARAERKSRKAKVSTADDIMDEILS